MSSLYEEIVPQIRSACQRCYLDNAAMSLQPEQVTRAVADFYERRQRLGPDFTAWWERVDELRELVAEMIHAHPQNIMFLQNTSMGINLAAGSIPFAEGDNVVITDMEFPSNAYPWFNLRSKGVEVRVASNRNGMFLIDDFAALCDERTRAVSVSWVIAANGCVLDLEALGSLCRERDIWFVVDAIQGMGLLELDVSKICADFVVSGFFKWLQGPDGLAFVYINQEKAHRLGIPFAGWAGMKNKFNYNGYHFDLADTARKYETGNLNFSAVYGAAAALEVLRGHQEEIELCVRGLTNYLRDELERIPGSELLSPRNGRVSGITLVRLPDEDSVLRRLAKEDVIVNHRNGIRISPHYYNTCEDIEKLLSVIR